MDATAERQPAAQGSLRETPLCHLALYVYRHAHTGTLLIADTADCKASLRVQRGRITGARLPWRADCLLDAVLPLCGIREGCFAFYEQDLLADQDLLDGVIDPYELLTASLESYARDDMVEALLRRFAGKRLRLVQGSNLDRLRLQPAHTPLVELIRAAPATPENLVEQAPMPNALARRLLYALLATNTVAPHLDRDSATFRSEIEPRSIPAPNATSARAAETGTAWQRLASLRPLGSLRPTNSRPPRTSARPPASSAQSQASVRPASLAPAGDDAASRQRRAEHFLQRGRPDDAIAETEALLATDPERADFLALHAQALFEKHQMQLEGLPRIVVNAIKKALEADPEHPRALYTKGLMFKRGGETKKALVCFRQVLRRDPKHIEAAREVRLAKLRAD